MLAQSFLKTKSPTSHHLKTFNTFVTYGIQDILDKEPSGGSSVGQNKLLQLILGYIYILKYLQSNLIG